jgi:hypothetical protein
LRKQQCLSKILDIVNEGDAVVIGGRTIEGYNVSAVAPGFAEIVKSACRISPIHILVSSQLRPIVSNPAGIVYNLVVREIKVGSNEKSLSS